MSADINYLNAVTQAFLRTAVDALNLTDAGAPGRAYVSPGEPALDCCGQVTVWMQDLGRVGLFNGTGALALAKSIIRGDMPLGTIFVQATRCLSKATMEALGKGNLPSATDLQASALMIDQDGWALDRHFSTELKHGELARVCTGAVMLGGIKLQPQGGCVGWTFSFAYPLEGGKLE